MEQAQHFDSKFRFRRNTGNLTIESISIKKLYILIRSCIVVVLFASIAIREHSVGGACQQFGSSSWPFVSCKRKIGNTTESSSTGPKPEFRYEPFFLNPLPCSSHFWFRFFFQEHSILCIWMVQPNRIHVPVPNISNSYSVSCAKPSAQIPITMRHLHQCIKTKSLYNFFAIKTIDDFNRTTFFVSSFDIDGWWVMGYLNFIWKLIIINEWQSVTRKLLNTFLYGGE